MDNINTSPSQWYLGKDSKRLNAIKCGWCGRPSSSFPISLLPLSAPLKAPWRCDPGC